MPVPDQRDPEVTRAVLSRWLAGRLPDPEITELQTPSSSGFSAETLLFTANGARYVAKVAPTGYQIFPEPRFEEQYRVLRELRSRGVNVPETLWYEPDPELLGAPFFVMEARPGRAPSDMPPYYQEGWVTEIAPAERAALWENGLRAMASVHRQDTAGLEYVDQTHFGPTGWAQRLAYYEHYLEWAYDGKVPVADRALAWLRAHTPSEARPPALLWGDARIGNLLYEGTEVSAILDWEMVTLGQPEEDLAWYLFIDRHHREAVAADPLPGLPTREETLARYRELLGRDLDDLAPYDVLAGLKFAAVMARIGQLLIHYELIGPDDPFPYDNTVTRVLDGLLDELA